MPNRIAAALAVVVAGLALGATSAQTQQPEHEPDQAITDGSAQRALGRARSRWRAARVTHYRFRLRTACFCPESVRAPRTYEVRKGKVIRPRRNTRSDLATVPRLHRVVQDAIDGEVAQLDVRYDSRGVPRRIAVDGRFLVADDEIAHTVDRFVRISGR